MIEELGTVTSLDLCEETSLAQCVDNNSNLPILEETQGSWPTDLEEYFGASSGSISEV